MKRLNDKLKLSVSVVALMCGGGLATSPALAVTYSGDETGVVISVDLDEDLIVSSTGSITPDGLLVNANVTGDLTNAGLIEALDSGTATSSSDIDIEVIAIDFNGSLSGDFTNSGIIKADASASVDFVATGNSYYSNSLSASASGIDINSVAGDVTNTGTISAVASSELVSSIGTAATPVTSISISDYAYAYAIALEVDSMAGGTISNSATISASATASADYGIVASGGTAEVSMSDISVSATATGVYQSGTGTYAFQNSGTVSATASSSLNVVASLEATTGEADLYLTPASVSAYADGVYLRGETTDFNNSGTISATASATAVETLSSTAQTSATVSVSNNVTASATAVYVATLEGDFTNTGTITATAAADLAVVADATDASSYAYVSIDDDLYAYANAVGIGTLNGSFSNTSTLSITASATAAASYDLSATGPQATVSLDNVSMSATATGVDVNSGEYDFTNSGSISATASAALDVVAAVNATDTYGYIWMDGDRSAYAYGADLNGTVTSFANSGSITATASVSAVENLTVAAGTEATVSMSNTLTASATAVFINSLTGDFTNSGTIAATASADLAVTASSVSATTSADIYVYDQHYVFAMGVDINDMYSDDPENPAVFTNSSALSITAAASSVASYNLSAAGPSAYISAETLSQTVSAYGANIDGGEYAIVNSGTISATATGGMTVIASAVGSESGYLIYLSDVNQYVTAIGLESDGLTLGFDNSGTISATATATLTETISASGVTSASVTIDNDVSAYAYGVLIDDISASATNSGTISATASATVAVTASAAVGADAGFVDVSNEVTVEAIGFSASFTTPAEDDPLHSFTNSGTIAASAALSVTSVVPASTTVTPTVTTEADLTAVGARLWGGVGTVANSGTISATGVAQNVDTALVIGLDIEEPVDGLVITNTKTISADLKGTAVDSTVVALQIGPTETVTTAPLVETAAGVITVTNSGTISATSEPGTSYGIAAPFAPLPLVINQQGGSISGDVAIELVNDNADTLNWTGGAIHGIVSADKSDVVNVFSGTGTPANNTVTADADFALVGGAALNIGLDDKAVTFSMAGTTTGTGEVNLNKNASLVMQTTGSIGAGTFNMDPATTLTFIFNPTDAGDIKTTGDANIDGTLNAVALPGLYGDKGSHVVILAGGDVVGTFDNTNINGDTLLIDFSAKVNPQDVTISWERNAFNEVPGLTINSTSVATALEEGYDTKRPASKNSPELNDILSAMFTLKDAARYDRVLNSWSGSEHAQVMRAAANLSEPYHMALSEHLNDIRHTGGADGQVVMLRPKGSSVSVAPNSAAGASATDESRFAFWGRAFGRWASTRGDVEATGFDEDTFGAVLGGDFRVSQNVTIGLATGYIDDKLDFDDGDLGKIKRWTIGGYLSATFNQFYIDGSLTYASDNYKVNRTIQYGNTSCLAFNCTTGAASKYNGDGLMGHAEVGYLFELGNGTELRPFAGLNYSTVDSDPFSETGGGDLGLDVLDGTGKSFQSRLGARLSGTWGNGSTKWIPELRAEWRHEFKDNPAWIVANLNGLPNDPFVAIGSKVTQDLAVVGAGITALMSNGVGVFFDYQGAFGSGYHSHAIQGGVRVKF